MGAKKRLVFGNLLLKTAGLRRGMLRYGVLRPPQHPSERLDYGSDCCYCYLIYRFSTDYNCTV